MSDLKQKVVRGTIWSVMEKFSMQFCGFLVTLVLSRLLTPNDYGTVALLSIFISISSVLIDSGFGTALVQKKDVTDEDFSSVFYLWLSLSIIVYCILFCVAPAIATFYKTPDLVAILRVISISLILYVVIGIQNAEMSRKMLFHLSFRISLIQFAVAGCVGIVFAYLGYGPWALVWNQLWGAVAGMIARWHYIRWRPKFLFSWNSVRELFGFGWKMTATSLLNTAYENLYGLLIGRVYTKADLAFVNKGKTLPSMLMDAINGSIGRVAFPALSQMQNTPDQLRAAMRRMITCSTFLVFPLMVGCALCARPLTILIFGDQWDPAVIYVQIACFSYAIFPFHIINLQAITALGRSDVVLVLEVIKKVIGIVCVVVSIRYGVLWLVAATAFVSGPLCLIVNAWPNRKLLNYTILMQIRDVMPAAVLSGLMGIGCWILSVLIPADGVVFRFLFLVTSFIAGAAIYLPLAWYLKVDPLFEYLRLLEPLLNKAKHYDFG